MPVISFFYGILIKMFFADHAPAHFHVEYGEFKAIIDIQSLEIIEGQIPKRALSLVLEWAKMHQKELIDNWNECQSKRSPKKIEPLK